MRANGKEYESSSWTRNIRTTQRDGGFSLVEVLVSIVLIGTAGVAILGAVGASARGANVHRQQADAQAVVASGSDVLMGLRPVVCNQAVASYQDQVQRRAETLNLGGGWTGSTITVTKVQEWDATNRAFKSATTGQPSSGCVTTSLELITPQLVTLNVLSPDGRATKTIQVMTDAATGSVPIGNPFSWNNSKFSLMTEGDVSINGTLLYAALAVGGDLRWGAGGRIGGNDPGGFAYNGKAITLVVNGRAQFDQSAATLDVATGHVVIGDLSNGKSLPSGGANCFVPLTASTCTDRRISMLDGGTVASAKPIDFPAASDAFRKTARGLASLPGTCVDAAGALLRNEANSAPWTAGNYMLLLTADKINVLSLSAAQVASLSTRPSGASSTPTRTAPLVVNVTDGGAVTIKPTIFADGNAASYIVWNFPNATSVRLTDELWGSIYAPNATVTLDTKVNGVVIAKSAVGGNTSVDSQYRPDITTTCPRMS